MRSVTFVRFLGLIGAMALLLVLGTTVATAQAACEQACLDQYNTDWQICDDELAADTAILDADELECANKPNPDGCLNSVAKRRRNVIRQHQNCMRVAEIEYENCLKECDETPAAE